MLDSFDNDTLCSNNFGDSQGPQAMAFRRLSKRNSGTTVGPTFYHRRSRSHDQGTFCIHCRLEVIPAAGTVAWANSLIPSAETLDREATAPTCVSQNLSRQKLAQLGEDVAPNECTNIGNQLALWRDHYLATTGIRAWERKNVYGYFFSQTLIFRYQIILILKIIAPYYKKNCPWLLCQHECMM